MARLVGKSIVSGDVASKIAIHKELTMQPDTHGPYPLAEPPVAVVAISSSASRLCSE